MTREVKAYGRRIKVYRVRRCADAWCSDRNLAHQIEQRREKNLRELRLNSNEVKELAKL